MKLPLPSSGKLTIAPEKTLTVLQRQFAIVSSNSPTPVLGTYGAGTCLIVAIYDPTHKKAFLAHIDTIMSLPSLQKAIAQFSPASCTAHLLGGSHLTRKMCLGIHAFLSQKGFKIQSCNLATGSSDSLAIDARSGKVFSPVTPEQLQKQEDQEHYQITIKEILEKDLNNLEALPLQSDFRIPEKFGLPTEVSSPAEIAQLNGDATRGQAQAGHKEEGGQEGSDQERAEPFAGHLAEGAGQAARQGAS